MVYAQVPPGAATQSKLLILFASLSLKRLMARPRGGKAALPRDGAGRRSRRFAEEIAPECPLCVGAAASAPTAMVPSAAMVPLAQTSELWSIHHHIVRQSSALAPATEIAPWRLPACLAIRGKPAAFT
jgi:hypothetical protein